MLQVSNKSVCLLLFLLRETGPINPSHPTLVGFIGPTYGWRLPFVIIALPSIFIISLVVLTMEEPERSNHGGYHHEPRMAMDEETLMGHSLARNGKWD